jgi:tetraprenyl-beta-curcumene synthase
MGARARGEDRAASAALFVRAAHSYWMNVFPQVAHELRRWHKRAGEISDPLLRKQALQALGKRGNMEGAAAFATFAPRRHRPAVVRATVAFQTAYNHLDTICEQAPWIGQDEARVLHEALLAALACPSSPRSRGIGDLSPIIEGLRRGTWSGGRESEASGREDARPIHPLKNNDDGYLAALVDTCQEALRELPSYGLVAPAARRAAERVACFQAFNRYERDAIEHWGREQTPPGSDLRWWETAASGGSSLGVHVMIAAAAEQGIDQTRAEGLERAYFPWIGALHSMLDHLIDIEEDAHAGQSNLIELYGSPAEAAERMALLAGRALECARELEPRHRHELIVAAMASFYLAAPEARVGEAVAVTQAVLDVFGGLARPALSVFRARQGLSGFGGRFGAGIRPAQGQSSSRASSAGPSSIRALRSIGS